MNHWERMIERWKTISFVFALLYALLGVLVLLGGLPASGLFLLFIAGLFGIGAMQVANENYSTAKVLLMIGGVLGMPLGFVMFWGGMKIGEAADMLADSDNSSPDKNFTSLKL